MQQVGSILTALTSFRVHAGALVAAFVVGLPFRFLGLEGAVGPVMVAVWMGLVLVSAFGVGTGVAHLNCPACRKMVKMGSERCHHCGEALSIKDPGGAGTGREDAANREHERARVGPSKEADDASKDKGSRKLGLAAAQGNAYEVFVEDHEHQQVPPVPLSPALGSDDAPRQVASWWRRKWGIALVAFVSCMAFFAVLGMSVAEPEGIEGGDSTTKQGSVPSGSVDEGVAEEGPGASGSVDEEVIEEQPVLPKPSEDAVVLDGLGAAARYAQKAPADPHLGVSGGGSHDGPAGNLLRQLADSNEGTEWWPLVRRLGVSEGFVSSSIRLELALLAADDTMEVAVEVCEGLRTAIPEGASWMSIKVYFDSLSGGTAQVDGTRAPLEKREGGIKVASGATNLECETWPRLAPEHQQKLADLYVDQERTN